MAYQLIAFDMDGTFLDSNKQIPKGNKLAVKEAVKQGKYAIISSGRNLVELQDILKEVPEFRYLIMSSGAMVYDLQEQRVIYSNELSIENIKRIMKMVKGRDIMIHQLSNESVVEYDRGHRLKDYQLEIYQDMFVKICHFVDNMYDYYNQSPHTLLKMNLYHRTVEERDDTYQLLQSLPISIKKSEKTSVECSSLGINKGTGLKKLCDDLGIDIQETIAVGDGDNDLEILEAAGLAIAMENATSTIKEAADVIVSDNDHGGCIEAVYEYLLKGK